MKKNTEKHYQAKQSQAKAQGDKYRQLSAQTNKPEKTKYDDWSDAQIQAWISRTTRTKTDQGKNSQRRAEQAYKKAAHERRTVYKNKQHNR